MKKLSTHAKERVNQRVTGAGDEISKQLQLKHYRLLKKVAHNCFAVLVKLKNGTDVVPIVKFVKNTRNVQTAVTVLSRAQYETQYGQIIQNNASAIRLADYLKADTIRKLQAIT
jgi:hypothetical protein